MKAGYLLLLLLITCSATAQNAVTVVTTKGIPIPAVHVIYCGELGISNEKGEANIAPAASCEGAVSFQHVGYKTKEVSIADLKKSNYRVALESSIRNLPELYISSKNDWERYQKLLQARPEYSATDSLFVYTFHFVADSIVAAERHMYNAEGMPVGSSHTYFINVPEPWSKLELSFSSLELATAPNNVLNIYYEDDSARVQLFHEDNVAFLPDPVAYFEAVPSSAAKSSESIVYYFPQTNVVQSYFVQLNEKAKRKLLSGAMKFAVNAMLKKTHKVAVTDFIMYGLYTNERELQLHGNFFQFSGEYLKEPSSTSIVNLYIPKGQENLIYNIEGLVTEKADKQSFLNYFQISNN